MGIIAQCRAVAARRPEWLGLAVLVLAACNLGVRLGRELVGVAEESLFANTALEIVRSGEWVGTTLLGSLDYYNSKPPLNVWLIALSFKAFGVGVIPLRLPSALAAWLTVAVLQRWGRRAWGNGAGIWASLVLATSPGFLYVHSGRSANADALLTLLMLLVVVTLWEGERAPWRLAWVGPLLGAAFLAKGFAVAMPALVVLAALGYRALVRRLPVGPLAVGAAAGAVPVAAWIWARWQVDRWRFFEAMWGQDVVARAVSALEGHREAAWYYLYVLQRNHPEWIGLAVLAFLLVPSARAGLGGLVPAAGQAGTAVLLGAWAVATLVVPSLVSTKLAWYLNPFLPFFALAVGWTLARAFDSADRSDRPRRAGALLALAVVAVASTEARLAWQSYRLDVGRSAQGLLLEAGPTLGGRDVFRARWGYPEIFLARAAGARARDVHGAEEFLRLSRPGDFLLTEATVEAPGVVLVGAAPTERLYRRDGER